jgi:phosphate transport system permease protein
MTGRRSVITGDKVFHILVVSAGVLVLLLLGAIIVSLFIGGLPALMAFGPWFLINTDWDPVKQIFGAGVPVFGTLITAVLALILAVPLAFGIAFYLADLAPQWLRRPVGTAIELLAAVPSIIYGMWGFFVIVPIMGQTVEPAVVDFFSSLQDSASDFADAQSAAAEHGGAFAHVMSGLAGVLQWCADALATFFAGPAFGTGIFTASLILAVMVIPFIAATMRDVFLTVPAVFKESAYGLGCTKWEVMKNIVIPYTKTSVVGGIMLGLGRALGETMAVTFVIGNTNRITTSIFGPGNTIASLVALEFPESPAGSLKLASLLELGFILFVISFIVLAISRLLLHTKAA